MSHGRRKIYSDATEITAENVVEEVNAAYLIHSANRNEISTLYRYYRNKTAIEYKRKEVRENINFKIGEARCLEVSSTSDTGQAVELRDGFFAAELRAKDIETAFKASEREHLKIVLRIMRDTVGTNLKLSDIEAHFTRRNYENIATKSQVLIAMLNNPWIHPEVAYASCGMFPDPESAYLQGKAWKEANDEVHDYKQEAPPGVSA